MHTGILGGTFVPCQAWTTAFFDKKVVGTANALAGGWGNSGGGFTFIIMLALYNTLVRDGLSSHSAWRAAFAIVPVPILLATAMAIMIFGTDHPSGKWSDRFNVPAAHITSDEGNVAENQTHEIIREKLGHARQMEEEATIHKSEATVVLEQANTLDAEVNQGKP
jgi:MFS transporter, NNP family, nitrate/nitrite transporter